MSEIDELKTRVETLMGEVAQVKIVNQRTARDSKAYGALNQGELESLREDTDAGFRGVHERMDALVEHAERNAELIDNLMTQVNRNTELLNDLLGLLRGNVARARLSGPADENKEDPTKE